MTEFLNTISERPNSTIPDLHLYQTYTLITLNHNFVAQNNKTEKKHNKLGNSSHPQVSTHYHRNKTICNSQTWHSPNMQLQRWSHKDDETIMKIHLTFATQLVYPIGTEITGQQESLTQHQYELL